MALGNGSIGGATIFRFLLTDLSIKNEILSLRQSSRCLTPLKKWACGDRRRAGPALAGAGWKRTATEAVIFRGLERFRRQPPSQPGGVWFGGRARLNGIA